MTAYDVSEIYSEMLSCMQGYLSGTSVQRYNKAKKDVLAHVARIIVANKKDLLQELRELGE